MPTANISTSAWTEWDGAIGGSMLVAVGITSLMGMGVYGYLIGLVASLGLCGLGGIALVAGAVWIETRDPDFV